MNSLCVANLMKGWAACLTLVGALCFPLWEGTGFNAKFMADLIYHNYVQVIILIYEMIIRCFSESCGTISDLALHNIEVPEGQVNIIQADKNTLLFDIYSVTLSMCSIFNPHSSFPVTCLSYTYGNASYLYYYPFYGRG